MKSSRAVHWLARVFVLVGLVLADRDAFAQLRLPLDLDTCGKKCAMSSQFNAHEVYFAPSQDVGVPFGESDAGADAKPAAGDYECRHVKYLSRPHKGTDFMIGGFSSESPCDDKDMDAGSEEGDGICREWRHVTIVAAASGVAIATLNECWDGCNTGDCACDYVDKSLGKQLGNQVVVRADNGQVHYYGHMRKGSVEVSAGDRVTCGQALGEVGSSGWSTGPHLHFEVRIGNVPRDPYHGACSPDESLWLEQGKYGVLPGADCFEPCASGCTDGIRTAEEATACVGRCSSACTDGIMPVALSAVATRHQTLMAGQYEPCDTGGGDGVHVWNDLVLQDYCAGLTCPADLAHHSAIVFNPTLKRAFLVEAGFWAAYKCLRDGSGPTRLGSPVGEAQSTGYKSAKTGNVFSGSRQVFTGGNMWWGPGPTCPPRAPYIDPPCVHVHVPDGSGVALDDSCADLAVVENEPGPAACAPGGECEEGESICTSDSSRSFCGRGFGGTDNSCLSFSPDQRCELGCIDGDCRSRPPESDVCGDIDEPCCPGEYQCYAGRTCDADSLCKFIEVPPDTPNTPACLNACSVGMVQCADDAHVLECQQEGDCLLWSEPKQCPRATSCHATVGCAECATNNDCSAAQYCREGSCETDICPQGETFCSSEDEQSDCNTEGSDSTDPEPCEYGCDAMSGTCNECPKDCKGKCGGADDGCGGSCDGCKAGQTCEKQKCVGDPCVPDPCNGNGTCDGGDCVCNEKYTERDCSSCALGYHGYPDCLPNCEAAASENSFAAGGFGLASIVHRGNAYGAVWEAADGLRFGSLDGDGVLQGDPVSLGVTGASPGIAWAERDGRYGVVSTAGFLCVSPTGATIGSSLPLIGSGATRMWAPAITYDGAGSFGLAWVDDRSGDMRAYFNRVDTTTCQTQQDDTLIASVWSSNPSIAYGAASYAIAWVAGGKDVYVTRLAPSGEKLGDTPITVGNTTTAAVLRWQAASAQWGIAWSDQPLGVAQVNIFMQLVDEEGATPGGPMQLTKTGSPNTDVALAADAQGFGLLWRSDGVARFKRVDGDGVSSSPSLEVAGNTVGALGSDGTNFVALYIPGSTRHVSCR